MLSNRCVSICVHVCALVSVIAQRKTYSIFGGDTYQERGLIPRTVSLLFSTLRERQAQLSFKCTVSFTEIYKETVYDLLDPSKRSTPIESWTSVQVFEGEQGIILRNLNVFVVPNEQEALKLFFLGAANRVTSSTAMNLVSSRSHAVFTMLVETEGMRDQRTVYTSGKVNLVDLAGSERVYKLHNTADSIKEAKAINLSLHFLEHVILALRDQHSQTATVASSLPLSSDKAQRAAYVPYRNSVLTNMLRDSLGGNCRSSFLLTINPQRSHFEECVATCRFGQRCGEVKVVVQANSEIGLSDQLRDMAAKLKALERQLATADEQRNAVEELLREERFHRQQQTSLRALSALEKNTCTQCVQDLLNSARAFVDGIRDGDNSAMREAESLVEASQDVLYKAVEGMDKAVLVELSTALGGLVQSIFVEYQLAKKENAFKERQRLATEQQEAQRKDYERRLQDLLLNSEDVAVLPRLPDKVVQGLLQGAVFLKRDRMGREAPRFVSLSDDLRNIIWEPLGFGGGSGGNNGSANAQTGSGGSNSREKQQSSSLGSFTGYDFFVFYPAAFPLLRC